jgi:protein-tyrosine phosphatase
VSAARTFEGLVNFRDLGGLPVAGGGQVSPGRLFRSDSLCYATEADAQHLVDELRLATIVDLREPSEIEQFGRGPLEQTSVGYLPVPIGDAPTATTRSEFYATLLGKYGRTIADMIRTLSRPDTLPAIIHCHIGCDRTGAVSAAVLSLIGVSGEDVAIDYARSRRANDAIRDRSRERRRLLGLPQMPDSYYEAWDPRAEIMATTLDLVAERWGDMHGWASTMGLTPSDIDALKTALVS